MAQRKLKVSVTLPADVLAALDRQAARRKGATRSGLVELAVRSWVVRSAAKDIEDATAAYYSALTDAERAEDRQWARAGEPVWRDDD